MKQEIKIAIIGASIMLVICMMMSYFLSNPSHYTETRVERFEQILYSADKMMNNDYYPIHNTTLLRDVPLIYDRTKNHSYMGIRMEKSTQQTIDYVCDGGPMKGALRLVMGK